jgi:hypothetical protein
LPRAPGSCALAKARSSLLNTVHASEILRGQITVTPATFRKLALSLPEAYESSHLGHADFRVRKRIFATLAYPDIAWAMVKLTPAQQQFFVGAHPAVFKAVKGGWGLKGATNVKLRAATVAILRQPLEAAWENVAPPSLAAAAFNRTTP